MTWNCSGRLMLALACLLVTAAGSFAQDYPSRTIKLVVPYAAGGGTDAMARFLARGMESRLGQPIVVENKPGSGTTIGGAFVAKSTPDGYTLLMATSSTVAIAPSLYKTLPYDPAADFMPISMLATVPFVLVVNPALGVATARDLIARAKSGPGELSYATGGAGSPHHVFMELLKGMSGIDLKHVAYRGGGPALIDIVAGHVPIGFADVGPALDLIRTGKVTALGVTTAKRVETMPQVPTLAEAGITGYEANSWQVMVAPAAVPPAIVARLNAVMVDVMAAPETQRHFLALGMQPMSSTPAAAHAYIKSEIVRWGATLAAVGGLRE